MNVLSLFDGMSCGRIALEVAGKEVTRYYASEIDEYAIKVTRAIWLMTIQLGSIVNWRDWDIDWKCIDLLIGGSPCQGFSFAGKQAGTTATLDGNDIMVTTREIYLYAKDRGAVFHSQSYLFWEYVLCLDHIKLANPNVKYMLENVKMKKELLQMISEIMGVEPVFINSALVSAQNRQRYYWANWQIEQPEDKGILLADILEQDPQNPTFMSDKFTKRNAHILRDDLEGKAKSLSAMEYVKNGRQGDYINHTVVMKQKPRGKNKGFEKEVSKSPTLSANSFEHNNHVKEVVRPSFAEWHAKTKDYGGTKREYSKLYGKHSNHILSAKAMARMERKKYSKPQVMPNKTGTLNTKNNSGQLSMDSGTTLIPVGLEYRKLTPRECGRLQTVPEPIIDVMLSCGVSNTQLYKMFGNGWTVDVIVNNFSTMEM